MTKVALFSVDRIELITVTTNQPKAQLTIVVHGQATTPGWTDITLEPLEATLSADGILDLVLSGKPPAGFVPQVLSPVSASLNWTDDVDRIIGVRVVARSGDRIAFRNAAPAPHPQPQPLDPQFISDLIGRPIRVIRPGEAVTADFNPERVNFVTDQRGLVTRFYFG